MAADTESSGEDVGYVNYMKGDSVFLAGTPSESRIFYIAKGTVDLSLGGSEDSKVIRNVSEGQFFGEMAALSGNTRTISATVASAEARLLFLSPAKFLSILAKNGALRLELCRHAARRYTGALVMLNAKHPADPEKKKDLRGRIDIQRRFNIDEFTSVLPLESYFEGDVICDDGILRPKKIYWVTNGEVQLNLINVKQELLAATLKKGEFFGVLSLLAEDYSVRTRITAASSRVSVRYLDEKNFLDLSDKNPLFAYSLMKTLLLGAENLEMQLVQQR
jgi:CRP-like cAMP-binding protein